MRGNWDRKPYYKFQAKPFRFSERDRGKKQLRNKDVKYLIPGTTRKSINDPFQMDNLSLLLQKYAPFATEKGTYKASVSMLKRLGFRPGFEKIIGDYTVYLNLYLEFANSVGETFVMKTRSRLIIGLGDESVYETSIRLLRNYGVPYIPGSALKGISRSYAVEMLAELLENSEGFPKDFYERAGKVDKLLGEGKAEEFPEVAEVRGSRDLKEFLKIFGASGNTVNVREIAETLIELFGTTEGKGRAIFLDALPSPNEKPPVVEGRLRANLNNAIEFDIMNPHYGPYYQGKDAPGNWHSPVPVLFLTVRTGVQFVFAVGGEMKETARELLRLALKNHGVGAKTSLGYGRFE